MSSHGTDSKHEAQNEATDSRENENTISSRGYNGSRDNIELTGVCRDANNGGSEGRCTDVTSSDLNTEGIEPTDLTQPELKAVKPDTENTSLESGTIVDKNNSSVKNVSSLAKPELAQERERARDKPNMPGSRKKYTSLLEDTVPLNPVDQAQPLQDGIVPNGTGASPTPPQNGTCKMSKGKHPPKIGVLNGGFDTKTEKQMLVPEDNPVDPGQKRVSVDSEDVRLLDCFPARD
ncbi:hypothetical protein EGW08_018450, partial [Elysia chlorotica]